MILSFLSHFDLFQSPVKFYFNGGSKLYSSFGIFVSFCLYGFLLFSLINSDLFKKQQPIIITQSLQMTKADPVQFDSNIILTFAIVDYRGNRYWDPSIFTIVARYYTSISNFIEKELKSCVVLTNNQAGRIGTNLNNTLCLLNDTFTLEGSLDDSNIKYLSLSILPCNNKTSNNTCKTTEEINEYIDTFPLTKYFALRYHNAKTDLNNYEHPFKWNSEIESQYLNSKIQRDWYLYFKNAEIETDDGWFFSSKNTLSDIMLSEKIADFRLRAADNDAFFIVTFFASKAKYISTRRYKKMPEVLAEISGIAQFFITFFLFLTRFVIYLGTLNKVMSKLYIFPKIGKKKKCVKKNSFKKNKKSKKQEIQQDATKKTKNKETAIFNDNKNEVFVNNNTFFDSKKILCEINFDKASNIQEENIKKDEVFNKIIENKPKLPKESAEEISDLINPNHLQPKVLIDDSIMSERFSIEKENALQKQKTVENSPNNPSDSKSKSQNIVFSSEISEKMPEKPSIKSPNVPLTKDLKKSLFSKIIEKSRNFSHKFTGKNLSKIKNSQETQNFKLNVIDYLHFLLCKFIRFLSKKKLSEFHEIIEQAEKTYKKDMDSINLVKKNHDLEKLKMLILNEDQLVLFNFLSKPTISPNSSSSFEIHDSSKKITELMRKQALADNFFEESYQRVLKNEENSEINRRLIQYLDIEIKKLK